MSDRKERLDLWRERVVGAKGAPLTITLDDLSTCADTQADEIDTLILTLTAA